MLLLVLVGSAGSAPCASVQSCQNTTLWHLPGPNPLISPGAKLSWMSTECEVAGGVTKVNATYYCLYHWYWKRCHPSQHACAPACP